MRVLSILVGWFVVACVDARTEIRLASGFNRRNRLLEGASPIWNGTLQSASLCLSACVKLKFHLSLTQAQGFTYFDLGDDREQIQLIRKKEACLSYGRCVEQCEQGPWSTTSTSTTPSVDGELNSNGNDSSSEYDGGTKSSSGSSTNKKGIKIADINEKPETLGSGLLLLHGPLNFNDSNAFCISRNLSLAMPENKEEHNILVEAMRSRGIRRMWIGVRKITEGGVDATYMDGRAVSRNLLLWGDGQPNNSRGGQICVEMNASLKYLWNDFDCLYKSAFVCR